MTTAAQIITQVRDILNEPTAAQWTDAQLRRWINEGGRDLARVTRHIKRMETIAVGISDESFTLPDDIIAIEVLWWQETGQPGIVELSPHHLEEWNAVRGGRTGHDGRPYAFTTMGSQPNLTLFITPGASAAGTLTASCAVLPGAIADSGGDDTDPLDLPPTWYDALADYVEFKALRRDRDPRWQEAYQLYQEKRDALVVSPDYLAESRGIIANPATGSYVPEWLSAWD